VWNQRDPKALAVVAPTGLADPILDCAWSPHYPTVVAGLTAGGKVGALRDDDHDL
jgi:hypothetical protein